MNYKFSIKYSKDRVQNTIFDIHKLLADIFIDILHLIKKRIDF